MIPAHYTKNERILRALWLKAKAEGFLKADVKTHSAALHIKTAMYQLKKKALRYETLDAELNTITEIYGVAGFGPSENNSAYIIIKPKVLGETLAELEETLDLREEDLWGAQVPQEPAPLEPTSSKQKASPKNPFYERD